MKKSKKKSRKINLRHIKPTATYDFKQLSKELNRTLPTIRRWRRDGMPIIPDSNPALVDGAELLQWLKERQKARKCECADDQAFCFTCKAACHFAVGSVVIRPVNKKRFSIDANCADCGGKLYKGASMERIDEIEALLESFMKNLRYIERYR